MPLEPNEFLFEYTENDMPQGCMGEIEYDKNRNVFKYRAIMDGLIAKGKSKETAISKVIKKWCRQQRKGKDTWNPGKKKV